MNIFLDCHHNIIFDTGCEGYFYTPVSLLLEFQPGETEKQFTVAISNITRIELYLSAGEGVYLTSFPRAEIVNLDGITLAHTTAH